MIDLFYIALLLVISFCFILLGVACNFLVDKVTQIEIEVPNFYNMGVIPMGRKRTFRVLRNICYGISVFCSILSVVYALVIFRFAIR